MRQQNYRLRSDAGYNLIELLLVGTLVSIIAVFAMPNWFRYIDEQKLNQANDMAETLFRAAQNRSKQEAQSYIVELRMNNNIPQASLYRVDANATNCWTYLSSLGDKKSLRDDCQNLAEAKKITMSLTQGDRIAFRHDGSIKPDSLIQPNEKITLSLTGIPNSPQRCVRIKTLLGSMDKGKNSSQCLQS